MKGTRVSGGVDGTEGLQEAKSVVLTIYRKSRIEEVGAISMERYEELSDSKHIQMDREELVNGLLMLYRKFTRTNPAISRATEDVEEIFKHISISREIGLRQEFSGHGTQERFNTSSHSNHDIFGVLMPILPGQPPEKNSLGRKVYSGIANDKNEVSCNYWKVMFIAGTVLAIREVHGAPHVLHGIEGSPALSEALEKL
ncbi:hypothetical protein HHK36_007752 [Tetracentron sinense]|uniref:Uncharacterized protein n=1 Tax=Tetracentron sinense TaxID=13715 RepID=A0A834ZH84_TETSI|nr:hypothetical protein HHK36_007752 [Tetracentron sinense]